MNIISLVFHQHRKPFLAMFALTLLSGLLYQWGGLLYALIGSAVMLAICWLVTLALPVTTAHKTPATA